MSENFKLHLLKCVHSECYCNQNLTLSNSPKLSSLKMSAVAILKIITTKHQNRAWMTLILYCITLTSSSFLMTTSYSKNIIFQILISSFISLDLFTFQVSGITDLYCIMDYLKNREENKNKWRTIYPKNHENFKNSKSRAQFYWFSYKKSLVASSHQKERIRAL